MGEMIMHELKQRKRSSHLQLLLN